MAVLISAHNLTKSFGSKLIFKDLAFSIDSRQKIGLIGPNGAGKSTLLKILAQKISPDRGTVAQSQGLQLSYLEQDPLLPAESDVFHYLTEQCDDPHDPRSMAWAQELMSKLELESHLQTQAGKLSMLSEGWKKRVALAAQLVRHPNLLLMDEPTNHLDVKSILWLEHFLNSQTELATLIVTHDRLFLQNVCDVILDLDPQLPNGILKTQGGYAAHLESRAQLLEAQKRLEDVRQNTYRRELEWLRRGPIARLAKQKARINSAYSLKSEVDELVEKNRSREIEIQFSKTERAPKKLIELKNVDICVENKVLVKNFSSIIRAKSRIGLLGSNGCGKSTLLKVLIGERAPTKGAISRYDDLTVNYFEQKKQTLDLELSLLKNLVSDGDYVQFQGRSVFGRGYLARFHFRADQMDLPAKYLSGGEKSRLFIAKMMLQESQLLILDEPTNDLDLETLDVLAESLSEFDGAVILVSHNRHFMDEVCKELWAFTEDQGEILKFADYFQWLDWFEESKKRGPSVANNKEAPPLKDTPTAGSSPRKGRLSYKEQLEFDQIEESILAAEELLEKLQVEITQPEVQSQYQRLTELTGKISSQQGEVERLYQRWALLTEKKG